MFLLTTPPSTPFYIFSISFLTAAKPRLTRSKQCPACIFRANFSSFDQKPNLTTGAVETRRSILIPSGVLAVHSLWTSLPLHPLTLTICLGFYFGTFLIIPSTALKTTAYTVYIAFTAVFTAGTVYIAYTAHTLHSGTCAFIYCYMIRAPQKYCT